MLALRGITTGCSRRHTADTAYDVSDHCSDTPVLTPGKYRPLTAPEITAIMKDDSPTPYIGSQGSRLRIYPETWEAVGELIAALRILFGPHIHPLTDDMVRQFVNHPVYYFDYNAVSHAIFSELEFPHRKSTRKHRLFLLSAGLMTLPFGKIGFRQPRDGVVLRSIDCFLPGKHNDLSSFFEPYSEFPHEILMVERSGLVMDEENEMPLIVFAEKLD